MRVSGTLNCRGTLNQEYKPSLSGTRTLVTQFLTIQAYSKIFFEYPDLVLSILSRPKLKEWNVHSFLGPGELDDEKGVTDPELNTQIIIVLTI